MAARTGLYLAILIAALVTALSFTGTFFPHGTMMSGMQGMMGTSNSVMIWPSALTASSVAIAVAVAYLIAFPTIKYSQSPAMPELDDSQTTPINEPQPDPIDIVMRVLKPDENAVLQLLRKKGGVCMQRDITYETGLSKLKTHRVVARLAERGVIQVRKMGKTNEITVPAWLRKSDDPQSKS